MKKKLALFTSMVLVATMIPFASFAEKTDDFVKVVNGIEQYGSRDENKPVSFTIDLGQDAFLGRGLVEVNLKNVVTARVANPITAKFMEGDKEVGIETEVTFEDKYDSKPLRGNEDNFYMRIGGSKDLKHKGEQNTKLLITMKLDFSNSSLGDVDVLMKDMSETGISKKEFTIAEFSGTMQRSMFVEAKNDTSKIGKAGGMLSQFSITRLDSLDTKLTNNEVRISLPSNITFDKDTEAIADGKKLPLAYDNSNRTLVLKNVSRDTVELIVKPDIEVDEDKASYGDVKVSIELLSSGRSVDGKTLKIGTLTDSGAQIVVNEKGKQRIPNMTAGETKTVELTLDGVKGSFEKNSTVDFQIKGVDIAYKKLTIVDPKAKVMPLGDSAGKSNLVNGMEVYKNKAFSFKILESDIKQIKFEMDITADMLENGRATISMSKNGTEISKAELADVETKAKIETGVATVKKGTTFKGQDIIIREAKSGSFEVGDVLYITFDKENMGFDVTDMKIKATQNVEFSDPKVNKDGVLELKVLKKSYNAPARIDITGVKGYTLENVVGGMAKIKINLNKVDDNTIYEADYVNVLGIGGISNVTVFTIGSTSYSASGTQKEASAAPYVKNGYTMLPVRALAESLGLSSSWDSQNKTATFTNSTKIAVVELGKNTMIVNGTPIGLSTPAELKNGVTMIELRGLASAFGVDIEWNGAQKTATVKSK